MTLDANWKLNLNTEQAKLQAQQAIFESVQQVFEIDIKKDAVELSPVLTGTNRRSIDTEVTMTDRGVEAQLFSQSGYGGYLEIGTRRMKAQPYLFPAFNKWIGKLTEIVGAKVRAIRPGMFIGPSQKG